MSSRKRMIVRSIDVVEVPSHGSMYHQIRKCAGYPMEADDFVDLSASSLVEYETVRVHRFMIPIPGSTWEDVDIGWTAEAHEAIGIPLEAFDSLHAQSEAAREAVRTLRLQTTKLATGRAIAINELCRLESLGFWARVKRVFTGYKSEIGEKK